MKKIKLEMHVHTKYSKDSLLPFWALYLKCRICGIDYIAITEHNNIDGAKEFEKFCKRHGCKICVIVGEEIFTSEGEIIGLFLREKIEPYLSPEKTISEIKKQGGIVYVPHPFDEKREKTVLKEEAISRFSDKIDCIEIHNGRNIEKRYDRMQKEISEKYHIFGVVGSDAHTIIEIGRNYMDIDCLDAILTPNNFIAILKQGTIVEKKCLKIAHYITAIVKMLKMIREGQFDEVYHIIIRKLK